MAAAALSSFIIVALGTSIAVVLVGVVCASISGGIGEITFLALTARYHKYVDTYLGQKCISAITKKMPYKRISAVTSKHALLQSQKMFTAMVMVSGTSCTVV